MEISNFRHRSTSSSDRFLGLFSSPSATSSAASILSGHELHESDIFWTADDRGSTSPLSRRKLGFRREDSSGILAAIDGDDDRNHSSATPFRPIPKPQAQPAPARKFRNSAPIKVPPPMMRPRKFDRFGDVEDDDSDDDEMLPPHEIVAMKLKATSSVLEGVGRTLKGRDLRQVRNAVWQQTGFLD